MRIEILGRQTGTCSLTGKEAVEVFLLRAGGGETQAVSAPRVVETLRLLCAVGDEQPAITASAANPKLKALGTAGE